MAATWGIASVASAQSSNNENQPVYAPPVYTKPVYTKPVYTPLPPLRQQAPSRMSGLGGVRSQPGVRSAAPNRIPISTFKAVPPTVPTSGAGPIDPSPLPGSVPTRDSHRHDGIIGDGVSISGSYSDGPFRIAFHTGGLRGIRANGRVLLPTYAGGYGLPYNLYYVNDAAMTSNYGPTRYPQTTEPAGSSMQNAPPATPLTPDERAAQRLKSGDAAGAVTSYQAILKQRPSDGDAMRLLGASLIESGRLAEGVSVITLAYKTDSTLPERPLDAEIFQGGAEKLRQHLNRVSALANKERSGSSWFVLATLMQAEGRNKQAAIIVERARAAGLDPQLADELAGALSGNTR